MAVPDFQSWLLPLLRCLSDGEVHRMSDLYEQLAIELNLSDADREERLPSGAQQTYMNRIAWARTYLKKAGLVSAPGRSQVQITERGRSTLAERPTKLTVAYLKRFPEFLDFHAVKPSESSSTAATPLQINEEETPQESLERLHKQLRDELAIELLDRVKQAPPSFFERVVVDLLIAMGYGGSREDAGKTVGKSGDGGIDGVINEDRLGLDVVYIQAKRWEGSVGRPVVQAFAGSLEGVRANKGVLITTSAFTADAKTYVGQITKKIVLIDGKQLSDYMIQYGIGVGVEATYEVKRIDNDYFEI
ncbi:restriction endonuclease [Rudaea sp.]|uniref:restriction endonuclease n=1 Tax=Rudaea sp. TaxID=2136325 RepID=UPI00321F8CDB